MERTVYVDGAGGGIAVVVTRVLTDRGWTVRTTQDRYITADPDGTRVPCGPLAVAWGTEVGGCAAVSFVTDALANLDPDTASGGIVGSFIRRTLDELDGIDEALPHAPAGVSAQLDTIARPAPGG